MGLFEKLYTLFIIFSVLIGLVIGQVSGMENYADKFILPLLIIMLYLTFLQIPLKDIKRSFSNRIFTLTSIGMNFVLTPLLAWFLATIFLVDNPALWLGFIMLMVTPCTDWYIIYTGIAKGNTALSTSILPLNLILQLLLLPLYLYLFSGTVGVVDFQIVVESIFLVLIIPFILAFITRHYLLKNNKDNFIEKVSSLPVIFLCMAIVAMFASQGGLLLNNLDLLVTLILPILVFFLINFIIGRLIGKGLKFNKENIASLNLTTLARNSPVALAIAMTAFPHEPLIALVLVIGPLIELPMLALISYVIVVIDKRT
ncbi:arsenic resistance protein [Bacillus coahuilensis m2-6]|uniref:Arsenic resistance protein n=1 Tax=Bacillus coahuilensis p1.1.43 TaxID=1150625 RepID=A0A147KCJ8_9BACI|nr:arsenic resistance protein [Bacillus coahuilensis]KUP03882.1 arsenic resistance protein [Bacillus coahuilensis m2-6]KUP09404.1 arsenic resistance protein [Bacillus coahuilensis p1.1.43]